MTKLESDFAVGLGRRVHPPIRSILDTMSFRLAQLDAHYTHHGGQQVRQKANVTLTEWRVLALVHALGETMPIEIRRVLLIDKGQLSRTIRGLVEKDLLVSRPNPNDQRSVIVKMTQAGAALHDSILGYIMDLNEEAVSCFTPRECADFYELLMKLLQHNEKLSERAGLIR